MQKEYITVDGTFYDVNTKLGVIQGLEDARINKKRIRLFYGDEQGIDWLEENDVSGTVGRSTGSIKIPLLIKNARAFGGGAILDHCIVKLIVDGKTVYTHPSYTMPELTVRPSIMEGYSHEVMNGTSVHARFKKAGQAEKFIAFMKGERG